MPAQLLDGKRISDEIRAEVARDVKAFRAETGVVPGLTAVLVGDDPASQVYVRNKETACRSAGMKGDVRRLPENVSQSELLDVIARLNADPAVHGILVQLPLPKGIDESAVIEAVDPGKDVDGFHPENAGLLAVGRARFVPCTPLGVREMLVRSGIATAGLNAVVLGRSNIVGKPMAMLLLMQKGGGRRDGHRLRRFIGDEGRRLDRPTGRPARSPPSAGRSTSGPGLDQAWAVVVDFRSAFTRRADGSLCGDVGIRRRPR